MHINKPSVTKSEAAHRVNLPVPPCIMCVQYIGGCSVHQGVFSTLGGYHEYIGGYHEYIGGIS